MHFELFHLDSGDWAAELARLPSGLVCQSPAWLSFLRASQHGEPVAALLVDDGRTVGAFAGMVVRKLGLRILGSPFPGWTTPYMGFDLVEGVSRRDALAALVRLAFDDLRCVHLEMMDRRLELRDLVGVRYAYRMFNTWEVDLHDDDESLLGSFNQTCRKYIRRAASDGLVIEEGRDDSFIDDYYEQLTDVFARQHLVPTYPKARVHQLVDSLPASQVLLLRARTPDGQSAATGVFHAVDSQRAYGWGVASFHHLQHLHPNELLMFHAMNEWRRRGSVIMDMAGAGDYKRKYHPRPTPVPWIRISRYPFVPPLREAARRCIAIRQNALGRLSANGPELPADSSSHPAGSTKGQSTASRCDGWLDADRSEIEIA